MYIGTVRNAEEAQQAKELALVIFSGNVNQEIEDERDRKNFIWQDVDDIKLSDIVVAVDEDNRVIGVVRIVYRNINRTSQRYRCAGLTSICVAPDWRGKGLSVKVMDSAHEVARQAECEIALLVARKAVDHYYNKFDYWGLSSYNRVIIKTSELAAIESSGVCFSPCDEESLEQYERWYRRCYAKSFGAANRSIQYWQFLLKKMSFQGVSCSNMCIGEYTAGYVIHSGAVIHEIAFDEKFNALGALAVFSRMHEDTIELEIEQQHPLVQDLANIDFRISTRQCMFGGHMVKILDLKAVTEKLKDRIIGRATKYGYQPTTESHARVEISWNGKDAEVSLQAELNKVGFETTALLLGARMLTTNHTSLDSPACFNLLLPDQV